MTAHKGVIASDYNPFTTPFWVDQGYGITEHRLRQIDGLFGKRILEFKGIKTNEGNYPAFVAIRWGIAAINGGRLVPIDAAYQKCVEHLKGNRAYRGR